LPSVTLSLDTSAYTAGDVLAATQSFDLEQAAVLQSLVVIDKDDQKAALDLWFLDADVAIGAENSAPNLSDANAVNLLGRIPVAGADYFDFGGVSLAVYRDLYLPLRPALGTKLSYIAAVNGAGTPTYTAAGLVIRLGLTT